MIELTKVWEFVPKDSTKTDCIIHNCSENCRSNETRRKLRNDFSPEISADSIHIIVRFSQKYRSFIRENQYDILNGIEAHGHCNEEESSLSILNSRNVILYIVKKNNAKNSRQQSNNQLYVTCLRKS